MHDRFWRRYSSNKERLMAEEFDLVAEVPPFPAYALPPDVFPGFSAGSYGGSARGSTGIANVEYVYRSDHDVRGRIVGVSNTRPSDGSELLRQSPLWWASAEARIEETMTGEFPLDGRRHGCGRAVHGRGEYRGRRHSLPTTATDDSARALAR
jgi:hypothetical protein